MNKPWIWMSQNEYAEMIGYHFSTSPTVMSFIYSFFTVIVNKIQIILFHLSILLTGCTWNKKTHCVFFASSPNCSAKISFNANVPIRNVLLLHTAFYTEHPFPFPHRKVLPPRQEIQYVPSLGISVYQFSTSVYKRIKSLRLYSTYSGYDSHQLSRFFRHSMFVASFVLWYIFSHGIDRLEYFFCLQKGLLSDSVIFLHRRWVPGINRVQTQSFSEQRRIISNIFRFDIFWRFKTSICF